MTGRDVQILPSSPRDAIHLLDAHHALMQSLFPAEANNYLELDELLLPDIRFFGASCQGELVGCGALAVKQGYGEIKSMHVAEGARGRGIASEIVKRIISEAKREALSILRLETGDKLVAAHRLYERHGFAFRGPFGDYPDLPESMFMEKRLY